LRLRQLWLWGAVVVVVAGVFRSFSTVKLVDVVTFFGGGAMFGIWIALSVQRGSRDRGPGSDASRGAAATRSRPAQSPKSGA
jgi:hypothetical protein